MPDPARFQQFSAAARRVLEAAEQTARDRDGTVTVADLIHALWEDGSHAAESLRSAGYDDPALHSDFPRASGAGEPEALGLILAESRRIARQFGREIEIGTEHLLAGLIAAVPHVSERLKERGVDLGPLESAATRAAQPTLDPLPVDAELHLDPTIPSEAAAAARILDAAANRCREGLRVVEDCVRFTFDDAILSEQLKTVRHDLTAVLLALGSEDWIRHRDTRGDVGTTIFTAAERSRASIDRLLTANCKRIEESLRTLEEFSKLRDRSAGAKLESLRYRFYTIEQTLQSRRLAGQRLADARLYLLATDRHCPRGLGPVVTAAVRNGVDVVQLREKENSDRRRLDLAKRVREWTREAGVLFIVNDRPDLAALVDADGVHLGQDDLPVAAARRIVGANRLIGVSSHSIEQARAALLDGADYLGVGPTFPSATKSFEEFSGLEFVRAAAPEIRIPWFAIGGIAPDNVESVIAAGASRVAVSSAICAAHDPAEATRALAAALRSRPLLSGDSVEA